MLIEGGEPSMTRLLLYVYTRNEFTQLIKLFNAGTFRSHLAICKFVYLWRKSAKWRREGNEKFKTNI